MALSQSTMFLFLETNSLLKYELMLPEMECYRHSNYSKLRKDPKEFFEYTHMDLRVFDYILECVKDKLTASQLKNISAEDRLFITIRFMASGMSLTNMSKSFGLMRATTTQVINSTLTAIWETLHDVHLQPPSPHEMPAAADKFFAKWQFPNAVGAIGAKYIPTKVIKCRIYAVENALRKTSLVLTAVADSDFRFSAINVTKNINARESFDNIFGNAGFRELPESTSKMPYVILGNDTFPLKTHLLRPYHKNSKTPKHDVYYNNRLMAARVPVDAAFQILTEKFTVFRKPIILELEMVDLVVRTGCLLYNIVKDIDGDCDPHFRNIGNEDKGYLDLFIVRKNLGTYNNRPTAMAVQLRDLFRDHIVYQYNL